MNVFWTRVGRNKNHPCKKTDLESMHHSQKLWYLFSSLGRSKGAETPHPRIAEENAKQDIQRNRMQLLLEEEMGTQCRELRQQHKCSVAATKTQLPGNKKQIVEIMKTESHNNKTKKNSESTTANRWLLLPIISVFLHASDWQGNQIAFLKQLSAPSHKKSLVLRRGDERGKRDSFPCQNPLRREFFCFSNGTMIYEKLPITDKDSSCHSHKC